MNPWKRFYFEPIYNMAHSIVLILCGQVMATSGVLYGIVFGVVGLYVVTLITKKIYKPNTDQSSKSDQSNSN